MEGDISGDVKIDIKEEPIVDNEARGFVEYEENFTAIEVNASGIKVEQGVPFGCNENAFNIPESIIGTNTRQNSAMHVHNRIKLEDVIDEEMLAYSRNNNGDGIVIESDKFVEMEPAEKCNETIFESENALVKLNQISNKEPASDSNAMVLHHITDKVLDSEEDFIDMKDKGDVDDRFIKHSELIIEDVKTEDLDNLDNGTTFDKKIYRKLLDTCEELRVFLIREDLVKLRKTFKEGQCERFQKPSYTAKHFPCTLCPFIANSRFDLFSHIGSMHKKLAVNMNILDVQNMFPGKEPHEVWYRCTDCVYITKYKNYLVKHFLTHKQLFEVRTFSCASCAFVTKQKANLVTHMEIHKDKSQIVPHKCPYCFSYFGNQLNMRRHIKYLHKTDKLERFKCSKCPFKTIYKNSFRDHLQTHNKSRKLYKCHLCPFQTAHKSVLRSRHQLLHKNDEDTRKYECAHCSFKGKTKEAIVRHMLVHRRPGDVKIYKCDKCSYQTKRKCGARRHRQVHQDIDELDLVPCPLCPYQGRTKDHLRSHMRLRHPDPNNIKIYNCKYCSYQTGQKYHMKRHNLTHMSKEELTLHHCDSCSYKAKSATEVKMHFKRVHAKPPKEVKWHKCDQCDLQFRQPWVLKRHMACHKDSGSKNSADSKNTNLFYCYHCSYYTKRKADLVRHVPMHSNFFLKCEKCDFQTRYDSCMLRHSKGPH